MRRLWSLKTGSLFWRLLTAVGTVVVATLMLSYIILSSIFESVFARQLAAKMLEDARGVSIWAEPYLASGQLDEDELRAHRFWLGHVTEGRLWLVNASGVVVADTGDEPKDFRGTRLNHDWVRLVLSGGTLRETGDDPWLGSAITVGYPITRGESVIGGVFLFVPPTRIWEVSADLRFRLGLTIFSAAMIGLFASLALSRSFSRPIERLSAYAAHLGQKRFDAPVQVTGIREFEGLAEALRSAAAQLQAAFDDLVEEKQRVHLLIQEMAEGVVAVDERRALLLVNPQAGRLLGLPGPFAGLPLEAAGLPPELSAAFGRALDPQAPVAGQVQFRCGGLEVEGHVTPVITAARKLAGAVAVMQDVTAESQLRRMRENFVANVSHELRGPLASLSAGVEAMHDGLVREEARPRYLKAMLSEIGRLRRLVDELLDLSRLDAGMMQIPQEEFDLSPLCEGLAEKWEPRCNAGGIRLVNDVPRLRVVANYDRIEEILSNFLDNAVRFTPPGGTIRLFAFSEGEMIRLGVADTGVGIAPEHLPHLWDRFYKVDPARTRTSGVGTGLGLSIVKQLVERLGGEVAVSSAVGRGSTFSFTLVAARRP